MTKKITISVPDELHVKMENWKESFNFSKVFQDAISDAIQKKESFKKRLKEATTMDQVVERLRKERAETTTDYYEEGKKDGVEFAQSASYEDIQFAISWEPMNALNENLISYNPIDNEVLGDYFRDIIEEDPLINFIETRPGNYIPNDLFASWEEGFVDGIQRFWNEIKTKL